MKHSVLFISLFVFLFCFGCNGGEPPAQDGGTVTHDGGPPDGGQPEDGGIDGGDETVTVTVETWTLDSDGNQVALPGALAQVSSEPASCTTPCSLDIKVGAHSLTLTLAGWVQGPSPLNFHLSDKVTIVNIPTSIVETYNATIRHRLDRDLAKRWRNLGDSVEQDWRMETVPAGFEYLCPDTFNATLNVHAIGTLCVEGETVTYCKTRDSRCETFVDPGPILLNATQVEFQNCRVDNPTACDDYAFIEAN